MMDKKYMVLLAGTLSLVGLAGNANAHDSVSFNIGFGQPAYYGPPPVYVAAPPVYYGPPAVAYYRPAPVYYQSGAYYRYDEPRYYEHHEREEREHGWRRHDRDGD